MIWFYHKRDGSLCLEAAVTLPLVLLICWFILGQIMAVTAEVKLSGAVRRTAAEMSLAGPAARLLDAELSTLPPVDDELQDVATILASVGLPGQLLQDLLLDSSATVLLGPLVLDRILYWLDDAAAGQPGSAGRFNVFWRRSITDLRVYLDWQSGSQQLWICLSWQQRNALGSRPGYLQHVVPLWTGHTASDEEVAAADDAVWLLDNFGRGQIFRSRMGANLPYDFPVIARFADGTATSIKSIDLTAPTYAVQAAFHNRMNDFIEEIAGFSGIAYAKGETAFTLHADDIRRRCLLLVIPQNSEQDWLTASLAQLTLQAEQRGVSLQIVRSGSSRRYMPAQEKAS